MSEDSGQLKPDFLAALLTASRKPRMVISGLEPTEACCVSTALLLGRSPLLPLLPIRPFPYCSCLPTPKENCGSVHRELIWYAKEIASLSASDAAYPQSPPCREM